jgi:neutral ceramidase
MYFSSSFRSTKNCRISFLILLEFALLLVASLPAAHAQKNFRASFSRSNITPANSQTLIGYAPRKSEGVRDSIYHKVVILDDGSEQFYLISSDLAAIAPPTYDRALARLNKMFGIDRNHFWWTNTHTHSAPEVGSSGVISLFLGERYEVKYDETYTNFVEDQLVEAVADARKRLAPEPILIDGDAM